MESRIQWRRKTTGCLLRRRSQRTTILEIDAPHGSCCKGRGGETTRSSATALSSFCIPRVCPHSCGHSWLLISLPSSLLADPKARKVIVIEHPLLPLYIKEVIARILFENQVFKAVNLLYFYSFNPNSIQVPSVSFACSHLLSLFTVGRITGLVIDCGHLESLTLPVSFLLSALFLTLIVHRSSLRGPCFLRYKQRLLQVLDCPHTSAPFFSCLQHTSRHLLH